MKKKPNKLERYAVYCNGVIVGYKTGYTAKSVKHSIKHEFSVRDTLRVMKAAEE